MTPLRTRTAAGIMIMILAVMVAPLLAQSDVMMTGSVTGFGMDILPTASFTTDDWLNKDGMFSITIINGDQKPVNKADIQIEISHGGYGTVLTGVLTVVDPQKGFIQQLTTGNAYTINNTMITEDTPQMDGGDWSEDFKDEVIRTGSLPEGRYTMRFTLSGWYATENDPIESGNEIYHVIEIKNPTPPELITPDDGSDDTVTIPRFAWQRPLLSDLSNVNNRIISVFYNIKVWRMFGEDGSVIDEESAIQRIPIWEVSGLTIESVDFDPGSSWEELKPGRKYCWQVQAVDGTGRPISPMNEGKSDVWQFTCQFDMPVLNQPFTFYPFRATWSPARAGSGISYYRVRIADNADFAGAFERRGLVMTQFQYPGDARPLRLGTTYYFELQTTDDSGVPIGEPVVESFTLPTTEVTLRSPGDGLVSSTDAPRFEWDGTARFYVVMVYDDQSDWSTVSGPIEGTSWFYDGEELQSGTTYAWNVSPANESGDPVGDSSDTWYFSLPAGDQVVLVSPVDEQIDTVYPTFTWRAVEGAGQGVEYTIAVADANGSTIYTATTTSTSVTYPQDAERLSYGARYTWNVNATQEGNEIASASQTAGFSTPLSSEDQAVATMSDLGDKLKVVLADFPEFQAFQDMTLISITDETGQSLDPEGFMALFETFKIVGVSSE